VRHSLRLLESLATASETIDESVSVTFPLPVSGVGVTVSPPADVIKLVLCPPVESDMGVLPEAV